MFRVWVGGVEITPENGVTYPEAVLIVDRYLFEDYDDVAIEKIEEVQ